MTNIPTIDISPLLFQSDEQSKIDISKSIRHACETVGFFQIIGHGIDKDLIDNMVNEAQRFFQQSSEEKQDYAVHKWNRLNSNTYRGYFPSSINGKEGLDLCSPYMNCEHKLVKKGDPLHELNKWKINEILIKYWDEMWRIGIELLRAIARAFDLDVFYFDKFLDDRSTGGAGTISTFRLNFYPQIENATPVSIGVDDGEPLSCEEHCDGCLFTILYQHEIGGLQIEIENGKWMDVPVIPYAFVINTGKCLERWTNGCLKAVKHRVKLLKQERLSIPFFLEPSYSTPIIPLPTINCTHKYDPITYGQYITESNKKFKEYQRDENDSS
ncbi:unnamed protein product [Adineta steineri]|uniref:Fe2OG dioxygenase domain-containing protein n=1 Tax=Adineta steineri TaxID=433720 RepID=A0A814QJD0_9BILA|nr:unnamed protein product [Adineta steineri]CAF1053056.1 unnamed protein product [Adineta steineri]CAF1120300.1 unnamed protein product [Adineta steineri]